MLIKHGGSINITSNDGYTPVHIAAIGSKTEVIAMLMKHEASINITNNEGEKPIDTARRYKSG